MPVPNDCAIVAIAAVTGESRATIEKLADEVQMLQVIARRGTAPTETVRLLAMLGIEAHAQYVHTGTLNSWLDYQEWEGYEHGIYCVRAGDELHAVSLGPEGYTDLLEGRSPRRRPLKGGRRRVEWLIHW